ncbi:DNA primase [Endozoicomonas montiporae]|uniref:DNA primase n=2 Tax=Endozoicomonas montiporae TaxID=1027273 RepID=A0A081N368_9GAMM|nr:DNA primase [Endozoicomonas montiporae]AMO58183.1 DNA primase [Endozoicomonas montiporae CL-33]KEQ12891.1 DNA primase [Endozoicomonas montiporae]
MAGRIPQTFIDDLLARVDIVDVIDSRVKLKKTGRNYSACCPFHKEKTPSFSVSPDKQFYYCFGCGASGNAIGFVMDFDHLDFPAAVDNLAGTQGMEVPREQSSQHSRRPDYSELYELMIRASEYYQEQLKTAPDAPRVINYLKQRGLDGQTCKQFGIGFAPPGWDNLQNLLATSDEKEQQLINTGMLVENEESKNRYDRFRDRVMFPIRDSRGRIIAFGGRVLGDAKPKYLNSPESPIFHKGRELYGLYEAKKSNRSLERILVVEGYMDVVALSQLGINNAVATLGTATTLEHMQRLFKTVPEVVFCFDGDDAGRRAAWRALESTLPNMQDGRQARFLFLPQGEDPDSMVRQEGSEQFLQRIQDQALSLDTFLFRELEDGLDLQTMDGRARLTKLAEPYLGKLPDGIFRQLLLQKLSGLTGLETSRLEAHMSSEPEAKPATDHTTQDKHHSQFESYNHAGHSYTEHYTEHYPDMHVSGYPDHYPDSHHDNYTTDSFSYSQSMKQGAYNPHKSKGFFDKRAKNFNPVLEKTQIKVGRSLYAIRHLLCNPQLAADVKCVDTLAEDNDADTELLVELLKTLKQQPKLATSALIAQWYGTEKGKRLQQVATLELGHEPDDGEFWEAIKRISDKVADLKHQQASNKISSTLANRKPNQLDERQRSEIEEWLKNHKARLGISTTGASQDKTKVSKK